MAEPPPQSGFKGKGVSPGDPNYWTTFTTCGSEMQLAAYWGFNRLDTFRHFYLSAHVLPFFIKFVPLRTFQKNGSLQLLLDLPEWEFEDTVCDPSEIFDIDAADISERERQIRINYAAALLARQLWMHIQSVRFDVVHGDYDEPDSEKLTSLFTEFTKATGCEHPKKKSPKTSLELLPDIDGRCEKDVELLCEYDNLCLELFCHFDYLLSPVVWKTTCLYNKFDDPREILEGYVPTWMRVSGDSISSIELSLESQSALRKDPKTVQIWWDIDTSHKYSLQYVRSLQDQAVLIDVPKRASVKLEHSMTGRRARDAVRIAFHLHEYSGQLQQLGFVFENGMKQGGPSSKEIQICAVNQLWEWEWIKDLLWSESELLRCYVVLRSCEEGESCFEIAPEEPRKRKRAE